MKKSIAIILTLILAFSCFVGCTKTDIFHKETTTSVAKPAFPFNNEAEKEREREFEGSWKSEDNKTVFLFHREIDDSLSSGARRRIIKGDGTKYDVTSGNKKEFTFRLDKDNILTVSYNSNIKEQYSVEFDTENSALKLTDRNTNKTIIYKKQ